MTYEKPAVTLATNTFNFRPSHDLWAQLKKAAKENHRSINQEMNYRLQRSFETYRR